MSLKSEAGRSMRPRIVEEIPRPRATDLAVRLAEQVRRLRIQAGLTQAELAARAGVTVETMERIGTALGVEVSELLSAPGRQKPKDDRLASVLRGVSAATKRRVIRVAEALVRDDRADIKPVPRRR